MIRGTEHKKHSRVHTKSTRESIFVQLVLLVVPSFFFHTCECVSQATTAHSIWNQSFKLWLRSCNRPGHETSAHHYVPLVGIRGIVCPRTNAARRRSAWCRRKRRGFRHRPVRIQPGPSRRYTQARRPEI